MANRIVLELLADANPLIKAMDTAQAAVKKFSVAAERAGGELGGGVNKALSSFSGLAEGGTVAAGVLAGALIAVSSAATIMAISAGKQAEELTQLSSILGANTSTLQNYDVLLNRVGLGGQDLTLVMKSLSQKMEEAKNGTGGAADRFRQLGIDITKVTGTDDLIRKIAESVSHFSNGTEKAAIMADLLGKSGLKFIPAFEGGAKAIDAAAVASERIGATMSGTQLAVLGSMDDAVDDLGLAWKRFGQQLGAVVAPAVQLVTEGLTWLLSMGSKAFQALDTAADTLAIRFSHVALSINEIASVIFSTNVLSGEAWKQTAANLALIDREAAKLIAHRRELATLGSGEDGRSKAPALVDTAKVSANARALADEQFKFSESLFKNEAALADARLTHLLASLDSQKSALMITDLEVAQAHENAANQMAEFTVASLETQIRNYSKFYQTKAALFTADEKGQSEKAKFEWESSQKMNEMLSQLEVAQIKSDTARLQSATKTAAAVEKSLLQPLDDAVAKYQALDQAQQALYASEQGLLGASDAARRVRFSLIDAEAERSRLLIDQTIQGEERKAQAILNLEETVQAKRRQAIQQFPSFFEQQMQAIVASNSFSMGQLVTNWTGGITQMILHGGNLKAAWEQTQQALVQASLNAGVQFLANAALVAARDMGLMTATDAAKKAALDASNVESLLAHESLEAAKTAATTVGETARMVLVASTAKAMDVLMVSTLTGMSAVATAALAIAVAVSQVVAGIAYGAAAIMAATPFGQPAAGALIVATTGFEFATGTAIALAEGIIQGALGAAIVATSAKSALPAFASGGIARGPSIFGEAGPEAAIPLNARGASFMQDAFGLGSGGGNQTNIYLDGKLIARNTDQHIRRRASLEGAFA